MRISYLIVITGFSITFLIMILSTYLSLKKSTEYHENFERLGRAHEVINTLNIIELNITKAEAAGRGYFIMPLSQYINDFIEDTIELNKSVKYIQELTSRDIVQQNNIKELKLLIRERLNLIISNRINLKSANYETIKKGAEKAANVREKLLSLSKKMINYEKQLLLNRQERVLSTLNKIEDYILYSGISTILIGVFFITILIKDMNRRKNTEKKLRELNENKNRFFSIISHDLRGPAYAAQQLAEIISEKSSDISETEKGTMTDMMIQSIKKVTVLLDELLEWARTQMNQIQFNPENIKLKSISHAIINQYNSIAQNKKISLHDLIDENCYVYADHYMTSTILRNLTSNAIKFTPGNRNIFIFNRVNEEGLMEIGVKDEGIGISEKMRESLFDIGNRKSRIGTAHETGTGIGLVLSKEFVEKQGGKIWVESKEDQGSTFKFTLPISNLNKTTNQRGSIKRIFAFKKRNRKINKY